MMRIIRRGSKGAQWRGDLPAGLPREIIEELTEMAPDAIPQNPLDRASAKREKERIYQRYGYLIFLGPFH